MNIGTATITSSVSVRFDGVTYGDDSATYSACLPWPPSANTHWRYVAVNRHPRVLLSERGRDYRALVARSVSRRRPLTGPLSVTLTMRPPTLRTLDLDNRIKPLLDALTHAGVWEDDSQVRDLHSTFGDVDRSGGSVLVRVVPLADAPRLIPPAILDALVTRIGVMCDMLTRLAEKRGIRGEP